MRDSCNCLGFLEQSTGPSAQPFLGLLVTPAADIGNLFLEHQGREIPIPLWPVWFLGTGSAYSTLFLAGSLKPCSELGQAQLGCQKDITLLCLVYGKL